MAKPKQLVKSDAVRALREAQQRYLEMVRARTGLSYSEIGRRAQVSPSTVTRFMNAQNYEGTLATLTISQIADAVGVPATAAALGTSMDGVAEGEAEPYMHGPTSSPIDVAIEALRGVRNAADPWVLRTRAIEDAGYLPGDVVIVDLNATAIAGDAVCAQVYDWDKMRAETVFRIFDEPYLVGASRDPSFRKPMLVDGKSVVIKGVVTDLLRPRRVA
ncbi:LexA family protein [Xanthobacter versatilis]|uniref:LexA family protein n=1 Tax=Xanthobacter autotrophicus (strain ATCC BAA-1158 / Py2) TaxID=78245 RepID=UPI00372B1A11